MSKFKSYKEFNGYSTAFRQHLADSHCRFIHGYALKFKVWFEGDLDHRNWVVDFGCFKRNGVKEWLKHMFDHTYLIATDDPHFDTFVELADKNLVDLREVEAVGCERFAELTFDKASSIIADKYGDRCWVESVTVREHESNSATCVNMERPMNEEQDA